MTRRLTTANVDALADDLRGLLAKIDADDLAATSATRYRIEGAIAALDVVAGRSTEEILRNLTEPS